MNLSAFTNYNGITLEIVIWSMFIGIVIGVGAVLYSKRVLGTFVRALLKIEANSPDSAKTFNELGFKHTFLYRFSLRNKSTFRKIVYVTDDNRYFIPSEKVFRADSMYSTKDASLLIGLLAVLAFFIMVLVCFLIIPDLVQMTSDFVGSLFGSSVNLS
ncbi:MAG: hypothetical protein FWF15_09190 [Oscillospiraceae bacterium]|nr:hypothetical protein [Oscillospiraceae bacterium]